MTITNYTKYSVWLVGTFTASLMVTVVAQCWWTKDYICATGYTGCSNNIPKQGWSREWIVGDGVLPECDASYSGFTNCDNIPEDCVQDVIEFTYDVPGCGPNEEEPVDQDVYPFTSPAHAASLWGDECGVASNTSLSTAFAVLFSRYF